MKTGTPLDVIYSSIKSKFTNDTDTTTTPASTDTTTTTPESTTTDTTTTTETKNTNYVSIFISMVAFALSWYCNTLQGEAIESKFGNALIAALFGWMYIVYAFIFNRRCFMSPRPPPMYAQQPMYVQQPMYAQQPMYVQQPMYAPQQPVMAGFGRRKGGAMRKGGARRR